MNITGAVSFVLYRRQFLNKPQTLNDKCSNPDSSGYIDDSTLRVSAQDEQSKDQLTFSGDVCEKFSCGIEKCISKSKAICNLFLPGPVDIIHNPTCLIFTLKRHIQPHVNQLCILTHAGDFSYAWCIYTGLCSFWYLEMGLTPSVESSRVGFLLEDRHKV
jgi:hypothetical protein